MKKFINGVSAPVIDSPSLDAKADDNHGHNASEIGGGTLSVALAWPGAEIVVVKARGDFGAAPGSLPAVRPAGTRTDVTVVYRSDTDPGALAFDHDVWERVT